MSSPKVPKPVLLFTAVLFSEGVSTSDFMPLLCKEFGGTVFESVIMHFVWSDYYEKEMGPKLRRVFMVYKQPFDREKLPDVKRKADELEMLFLKDGKRTVNIDPGLICLENIELATNKAFSHRVYLRDGVYVEVTLFYKHDTYQPIEYWTYPEYRSTHVLEFFNTARTILA
jgi:Domain of unknown function (DUF4416)